MKKVFLIFGLILTIFTFNAAAQQPTPAPERDPLLEADAKHNLEVANNYYRTKKAYKAVILRFEETFVAYPDYSKMDEFLYIAGMSSFYLASNKGKQKLDIALNDDERAKFAPEKLREDAKMYFTMLIEKYPSSKFKSKAETTLKELTK